MDGYDAYLILVLGWVAYVSLHSAMISVTVTDYLQKKLGRGYRFYRLVYNAVAIVTLIPIILYSAKMTGPVLIAWEGPLVIVKWALNLTGIALFAFGIRQYGFLELLGAQQIMAANNGKIKTNEGLVSSGILGMIRHPFYSGALLLFWAQNLNAAGIITNIILTIYIFIGTRLEERKLIREFGKAYVEYRQHVSMFFPWRWLKNKINPQAGGAVARLSAQK